MTLTRISRYDLRCLSAWDLQTVKWDRADNAKVGRGWVCVKGVGGSASRGRLSSVDYSACDLDNWVVLPATTSERRIGDRCALMVCSVIVGYLWGVTVCVCSVCGVLCSVCGAAKRRRLLQAISTSSTTSLALTQPKRVIAANDVYVGLRQRCSCRPYVVSQLTKWLRRRRRRRRSLAFESDQEIYRQTTTRRADSEAKRDIAKSNNVANVAVAKKQQTSWTNA